MSFYKLNKDYIDSFQQNILNRYNKDDKRTETGLLRAILKEVTDLFRKIGGQLSTKRNIPKSGEYPSSKKYNELIQDIGFDIDKLYNAQELVESDVKDLLNFNASQRDRTFENFANAQQTVYSAYIRSKKDLIGGIEVPAGNPFTSATDVGEGSKDVFIDVDRTTLTLDFSSADSRIADTKHIAIYFAGNKPEKIYPPGDTLGIGSHWKKQVEDRDVHFINQDSLSEVESYKTMMVDDPDSNTGVGFCEFEAVETLSKSIDIEIPTANYGFEKGYGPSFLVPVPVTTTKQGVSDAVDAVKQKIGSYLGLDRELIYIDKANSLQGVFIKEAPTDHNGSKYKLSIPFSSEVLTNEFAIEFTANAEGGNGVWPSIIWTDSHAFSNVGGSETSYNFISCDSQDGKYVCKFTDFIYPTRVELMLWYPGEIWSPIPFTMSHWVYSDTYTYEMPTSSSTTVGVIAKKQFDVYVDTEGNEENERTRAISVLKNPNRTVN